MSVLNPFISLAIYPAVVILVPSAVGFAWGWRFGFPFPREVVERVERSHRYAWVVAHALVLSLVLAAMPRSRVPAAALGLSGAHWQIPMFAGIAVGIAGGLLGVGLQVLMIPLSPSGAEKLAEDPLRKGTVRSRLLEIPFQAFAEEFWRIFCLVGLMNSGFSTPSSIFLTAFAYAVTELQYNTARTLGKFASGIVSAVLFVWQGSFFSPYSARVLTCLIYFWWIRRTRLASAAGVLRKILCPACGFDLTGITIPPSKEFKCPSCQESLRVSSFLWRWIGALALLLGFLSGLAIGLRGFVLILVVVLAWLPLIILGLILLKRFVPPRIERSKRKLPMA